MATRHQNPRILVVTPEVTLVRHGMGPGARYISARAGGLGDICNAQIHALYKHGLDVHLAMPNYRQCVYMGDRSGRGLLSPTPRVPVIPGAMNHDRPPGKV